MSALPQNPSESTRRRNPDLYKVPKGDAVQLNEISRFGKSAAIKQAFDDSPNGSVMMTVTKTTDEDKLNKTERAYLAYLRMLYQTKIGIQDVTFKIADDCRFTPDFNYVDENGRWTFVDVKGFQREDAFIKIKVAARNHSHLRFVIVKKNGTGWDYREVKQ